MAAVVPAPEFGTVELQGGDARVVIIPALGGRISELWFGERQWLWKNPQLPYRLPEAGASYALTADAGGFDECFPSAGSCKLPSLVRGAGGREIPDHGDLWSQHPELTLTTEDEGHRARLVWTGECLPYRFERTVVVTHGGSVRCEYAATNLGTLRMPFVWSARPLLPLTKSTRVQLPSGARVRVWAEHGVDLGGVAAEHRWPRLRSGGQLLDVSAPGSARSKPYACKLFVDLPPGDQAVCLIEGDTMLTARFDTAQVPQVGLWINHGGWNPLPKTSWLPWRKPAPYHNLSIEPAIGAPDSLSEALGAWASAHWLEAGETRLWSVTWSGGATPLPVPRR